MSWLDKLKEKSGIVKKESESENQITCKRCKEVLEPEKLAENALVCFHCEYHFRLSPYERLALVLNPDSFVEKDANLISTDPLKFKDSKKYKDRLKSSIKNNISKDSLVCGTGGIANHQVEVCVFNFSFLGGSMGSVAGEKITRSIERCILNKNSLLIFSCSGGARMQEGILSLMQMAKTASALNKLADHRLPFISILTDPTMGGVSASFAMLGDVIMAEPGALVGFAGPRVIEQTIKQKLPEGFQRAEFLLEQGLIDQVVHRKELRASLIRHLSLMSNTEVNSNTESQLLS